MNLRAELSLVLASQPAVPTGLYFRPADALRLEGGLAAVLREGRSLALNCGNEAALDHYADILIDRLRRSAACPVEIYFPASTQAMVARFDELLAGMTLQEALAERAGASPQRIWLVHDAGALAEHELQLLGRLVGNFPGAGVSVVLLLGPGLRSRRAFESLGRRFVRWDVEPPTPAQAQAMRELARSQGFEPLVTELLRHVQPARPVAEPASVAEVLEPAPEPVAASPWRRFMRRLSPGAGRSAAAARPFAAPVFGSGLPSARSMPAPGTQAAAGRASPVRRRLWWTGSAAAVLLAAASAWLALHPPQGALSWLVQPVRAFVPALAAPQPASPAVSPRSTTEQRT